MKEFIRIRAKIIAELGYTADQIGVVEDQMLATYMLAYLKILELPLEVKVDAS